MLLALLAFLLGAASMAAYLGWAQVQHERRLTAAARAREAVAHNRLLGAWKTGYAVPSEDVVAPAPPPEEQTVPLIPALQALVDDWDTPVGKDAQLRVIRDKLAQGKTQMEVLREIEPESAVEVGEA